MVSTTIGVVGQRVQSSPISATPSPSGKPKSTNTTSGGIVIARACAAEMAVWTTKFDGRTSWMADKNSSSSSTNSTVVAATSRTECTPDSKVRPSLAAMSVSLGSPHLVPASAANGNSATRTRLHGVCFRLAERALRGSSKRDLRDIPVQTHVSAIRENANEGHDGADATARFDREIRNRVDLGAVFEI